MNLVFLSEIYMLSSSDSVPGIAKKSTIREVGNRYLLNNTRRSKSGKMIRVTLKYANQVSLPLGNQCDIFPRNKASSGKMDLIYR